MTAYTVCIAINYMKVLPTTSQLLWNQSIKSTYNVVTEDNRNCTDYTLCSQHLTVSFYAPLTQTTTHYSVSVVFC